MAFLEGILVFPDGVLMLGVLANDQGRDNELFYHCIKL